MEEEENRKVRYSDKYSPVFKEGDYRMVWNQQIKVSDTNKGTEAAFDYNGSQLLFSIGCERFQVPAGLIHSTYPPAYEEGEFDTHIPQITFMNDSFPWERECIGEGYPWCILFLFDEYDGVEIKNMTIEDAFIRRKDCTGNCFVPDIVCKNGEKESDACTVLDIPGKLFEALMPKKEELLLLAHVRQVDVEDKATHLYITEGKFASIIGNRLCKKSSTRLLTHVHLISLEGYKEFFGEKRESFQDFEKVRVISLTGWKFVSYNKNEMGFRKLAENMDVGYFGQMKPEELSDLEKNGETQLKHMLQLGYRPLNHQTREGLKTVSWYKSPLLPYIPRFQIINQEGKLQNGYEGYRCLSHPDGAISYISGLYMLDTAYSTAWQLGRLLALKNEPLLNALYDIRRQNYEKDAYEKSMQKVRDILQEKKEEEKETQKKLIKTEEVYQNISGSCLQLLSKMAEKTEKEKELEKQLGSVNRSLDKSQVLEHLKSGKSLKNLEK